MWSLGCILAEMLLGKALFPGTSTINQIERIMNVIPPPTKEDVESIGSLYAGSVLEKMSLLPRSSVEKTLGSGVSKEAIDLLNKLLVFNPDKRITVEEALHHPYVAQFHNSREEPSLHYDVVLSLSDDIQLSINEYRSKLYEMIVNKKLHIRRIQHDPITKPTRKPSISEVIKNGTSPKPPQNNHSRAKNGAAVVTEQMKVDNDGAPLAQSECSDTDLETAKSSAKPKPRATPKQNGHVHHSHSSPAAVGNPDRMANGQNQKYSTVVNPDKTNHKAWDSFKPIAQQPGEQKAQMVKSGSHTYLRPVSAEFSEVCYHQDKQAQSRSWANPKKFFQRQGSKERRKPADTVEPSRKQLSVDPQRYAHSANRPSLGAPKVAFGSFSQNHGTISASALANLKNLTHL